MFAHEKVGGRSHPSRLLEGFTVTISDSGLVDLGYVGNQFIWEKSRGTAEWVQQRLDRGLSNYEWENMFPGDEVKVLDVSTSDHFHYFYSSIRWYTLLRKNVSGLKIYELEKRVVLTW